MCVLCQLPRVSRRLLILPTVFGLNCHQRAACQHQHPPRHRVELCHQPPWVETQGNKVFKEFGLKEGRFIAVDVVQVAPRVDGFCKVGAVGVKAFSFGRLDNRPDGGDLLGIADATSILQLCDLVLVESLARGKGSIASCRSSGPHLWGNGLAELQHV